MTLQMLSEFTLTVIELYGYGGYSGVECITWWTFNNQVNYAPKLNWSTLLSFELMGIV